MKSLHQTLNWDVEVHPLLLNNRKMSNRFALTRSDNGKILGIRSERYYPVYNRDLETFRTRLEEHSGFMFKGYQEFQQGKKILGFYENPSRNLQICGQKVKDYLIIGNSHDTSSKLFVGTSNYMIRCENQFSEKIRAFERRHDRPFDLNEIDLDLILDQYEIGRRTVYRKMEQLERIPADMETIQRLATHLLGTLEYTDRLEMPVLRSNKRVLLLLKCIEQEIRDLGPTRWAIFNGVTRYTSNHLKGNPGFGVTNGIGEQMNREAMRLLMMSN